MNAEMIEGTTKFPVAIPTPDGNGVAETVVIEVPCRISSKTGEELLTGEALAEIDRVKARYMGLLQPEHIKQLREWLSLTQKEISNFLQIGGKTYSRWETGRERPSRSMNILLRALWDGKLDVGYLRSIQSASFDWSVLRLLRRPGEKRQPYPVCVRGCKPAPKESAYTCWGAEDAA